MLIIYSLILLPAIAGLATLGWSSRVGRRILLVAIAAIHLLLTAALAWNPPPLSEHAWLGVDHAGLLMLGLTSVLFFATSIYTAGYLQQEYSRRHHDTAEGFLFNAQPKAIHIGCMLLFLAAMSGASLSQHFGLYWVCMEATTLASAPLIYFHRHHRSLEATWKYILICSVGIALALLGNFLLAVAASGIGEGHPTLVFSSLLAHARLLHPVWLKAALLFMLVGYGTKMGLAPMHSQLPDADSEAPPAAAALLSGALLNCAFLGIYRIHLLCVANGLGRFSHNLLLSLGLLSIAVAAIFIIRQRDFRRMLAYSSVEHMGILAVGVGLGGIGVFGAALHAICHSLTKAALFMTAGNIYTAFDSKFVADVRGLKRTRPITAVLWLGGFLAITGSPPFATFLSEFTILKAALDGGFYAIGALYLGLLGLIFIGMVNNVIPMTQGLPAESSTDAEAQPSHEPLWSVMPAGVLLTLMLLLGLWLPRPLNEMLTSISDRANSLEATKTTTTERWPGSHGVANSMLGVTNQLKPLDEGNMAASALVPIRRHKPAASKPTHSWLNVSTTAAMRLPEIDVTETPHFFLPSSFPTPGENTP